ncbi:2-hydroxyhepta-2,4-diene-1,7-dioate isomerase [Aureimonas endophytica]|uniref:2-hydroxyhepta-2,4-diene-1,7-dioate isomerase n=1 Tax=Aureimonas endophytica TaxID=2027858 RepID=A0A916ZZX0_9HYPH|nr:fumarylacetoacetate hydrolase family protein [Aureimonas endophytica]GGE20788.1 2-hydroxyhepta-2,4-diene-1,7-dioate isomerase [Aureimonas endophytica]
MRLVRFGEAGRERPGLIDVDNVLRDLSGEIDDLAGAHLSRAGLEKIRRLDPKSLPKADPSHRLGPPVTGTTNFLAVGRNYAEHAAETGSDVPTEPLIFNKALSSIVGPHDDVVIPKGSVSTDWEVELAIVIGERAHHVSEAEALDHVAGFCLCNDVSERDWQKNRGGQWVKGKSSPTFGPLGPWLVTPDEIPDLRAVDLWLDVNGERRQTGSTSAMIFGVETLIAYISTFMALQPGDVITTGTPPGVGAGMKPPQFLKAGDRLALGATRLGEQRARVVAYSA